MQTTVHPFELAGLGPAPYRFIGASREVFQAVPGDPNCPVLPAGSCDYCGQAIWIQCRVRAADGQTFKVGCDCIAKIDKKLAPVADRARAKIQRELGKARDAKKIAGAAETLKDEAARAKLAALPHPRGFEGRSLLDWADWMLEHAGNAGSVKVARALSKALAA